ncbi:hypothetical protein BJV78DRAFT_1201629 [Lactifluus subvellereus]|nr:hypothetical protein BJV78DRAFT_1201629 [Lactifluus subvellereus]
MSQLGFDVALGYNLLIVGASNAGVREVVSAYINEPITLSLPKSLLRANQKPLRLTDNRILLLDIIERPGEIFRECYGDLVRCHGVLLVYNPVSATSLQYVAGFHEQITKSKCRSLPVVLFSNTPSHCNVKEVHGFHGRNFAKTHAIPFIEASSSRSFSTPFLTLLKLARQHYETPASPTFKEGILDFVTVAAAKVSQATRSHLPPSPLRSLSISLRASGHRI